MPSSTDYLIPNVPNDLCFNCNEFTKEYFSVDQFLQDHRHKANLETMRDDLGVYLKVLRSAMIELINQDYADFVNLSSNLIGLDGAISSLQAPLMRLKEELSEVQQSLDMTMSDMKAQLALRGELRERKRRLKSLSRTQCALGRLRALLGNGCKLAAESLERAAAEFSQLQFHAARCQADLAPHHKQELTRVTELVLGSLDSLFLDCYRSGSSAGLQTCLSLYLRLGRCDAAETLFRAQVISPALDPLINEAALRQDPGGLSGLYSRILAFADVDMASLLQLCQPSDKTVAAVKGFDFFVRSFCPEVEERLELHLTSIYAAGDPDVFYQRYNETQAFLIELARRCSGETSVKEFKTDPQYKSFLLRWNLSVYFQIRLQEIAGGLEEVLGRNQEQERYTGGTWRLAQTQMTWSCLQRCWSPTVFLSQLAHRFWKLSLQILARYHTWSGEMIMSKRRQAGIEATALLSFLVLLFTDIDTLVGKLDELFVVATSQLTCISDQTRTSLKGSIDESRAQLSSRLAEVTDGIVTELVATSVPTLKQVGTIPRLFRRTNREAPNQTCAYVAALLAPLNAFHASHIVHGQTTTWLRHVFTHITKQYYTSVCDVLTSVQKTEESLRRLKKIRDRSVGVAFPNDRSSGDDDKIRLQLLLDVRAYAEAVEMMGVKRSDVQQLTELINLVESSQAKTDTK